MKFFGKKNKEASINNDKKKLYEIEENTIKATTSHPAQETPTRTIKKFLTKKIVDPMWNKMRKSKPTEENQEFHDIRQENQEFAAIRQKTFDALWNAIENEDVNQIKNMLNHVKDPLVLNGCLVNIIFHMNDNENNRKIVTLLLEKGKNINITIDNDRKTPLIIAVESGKKEMVKLLLDRKGVNINHVPFDGETALYKAVNLKDKEMVNLLLEKGADINCSTYKKDTALKGAVRLKDKEMVKFLIEKGANVNYTELSRAVYLEDKEMVTLLLNNSTNVNLTNRALFMAVDLKNKEMVKFLLEKGANVNQKEEDKETALYKAVNLQDKDMVKFLIKKGANVNENSFGKTPLYTAIALKDKEMITLLLNNGADINSIDIHRPEAPTPLYAAINLKYYGEKNISIVELLLNHNANINFQNNNGDTVLHYAIMSEDEKLIKLLLHYKADINIRNNSNTSPLDLIVDPSPLALYDAQKLKPLFLNNDLKDSTKTTTPAINRNLVSVEEPLSALLQPPKTSNIHLKYPKILSFNAKGQPSGRRKLNNRKVPKNNGNSSIL